MEQTRRDSFRSRWGFKLACIGSAVGMGNIWLFPSRMSAYGGATFLIPYVIFVVLIASTGVIGQPLNIAAIRAGMPEAAEATPEAEARVLRSEDLHTKVYVNQVETLWNLADARALARLMDCPVLAGSLWRREYFPCW